MIARPPICERFEILDTKIQIQRPALFALVFVVVRAGLRPRVPRRLTSALPFPSARRYQLRIVFFSSEASAVSPAGFGTASSCLRISSRRSDRVGASPSIGW
jgi:hypothetical protein